MYNSEKLGILLEKYGGTSHSHLVFLEDKCLYWSKEYDIALAYQRIFNKYIVLGNPIGDSDKFKEFINEFLDYCLNKNVEPVFYQMDAAYCSYLQQKGFKQFKFGEEATVDLKDFSLSGKRWGKLRTKMNKLNRMGYSFEVISPPFSNELLNEVQVVSDLWLGQRQEKGFSVGFLDLSCINLFTMATIRDDHGKLLAFATLPKDDTKSLLTIDLMRYHPKSPYGTMDVLFLNVFLWGKANHYQICSLGIAPLSNVGTDKTDSTWEKLGAMVYTYGNSLYKFKGLKEYKEKFVSNWIPKYILFQSSSPPLQLVAIGLLINKRKWTFTKQLKQKNVLLHPLKWILKKI